MAHDMQWEHLRAAIADQVPFVATRHLHASMELWEISTRIVDWLIILARLLPEGTHLERMQEDEVIRRFATLGDLIDYVQQAQDDACGI